MSLPTDAMGRKALPIATGVIDYFPDVWAEVARVSKLGNDQHNPGQPLHWDRSKSQDEADALMRHFIDRYKIDTDGSYHYAKVIWRACADFQKFLEREQERKKKAEQVPDKVYYSPELIQTLKAQTEPFLKRLEQSHQATDQPDGFASAEPEFWATAHEIAAHREREQRRLRFNGDGDING